MTEQQMPARIWCDDIDVALCSRRNLPHYTSYVRADIAERMAEALEALKALIEGEMCRSSWEDTHDMNRAEAALSAFRSATQDTEARHD